MTDQADSEPTTESGRGLRETREHELAERLAAVRRRIDTAALDSAKGPDPVAELIVVTKFFPASDVTLLAGMGVTDVGENKDQEAAAKAAEVEATADAETTADAEGAAGVRQRNSTLPRWHFIGQLQSNKAKSVVRYAYAVHSVDRPSLVRALSKAMAAEQRRRGSQGLDVRDPLRCFIQVNLDPAGDAGLEPGGGDGAESSAASSTESPGQRGGAAPDAVDDIADRVAAAAGLQLAGVMAVAPLGADPGEAFARLADISERLRRRHPDATGISAGMSHDLERALEHGATHLRVGSDVLGPRPTIL